MSEIDDAFVERRGEWPPRDGWTFFFLWVGGAIASAVMSRVLWSVIAFSQGPSGVMTQRWIPMLPSVALGVWHAWLLFTPQQVLRRAGWIALPILHAALPYAFSRPSTAAFSTAFGFVSILTTVTATALLKGVRWRPWLWLFIQLGGLVVTQVMAAYLVQAIGFETIGQLAARLNALLRIPSAVSLSGASLVSSFFSGVWLGATILAAWALAWWMPPIRREESTVDAA